MMQEGQEPKTEAEVLAAVVERNGKVAVELTNAINGTFQIEDEVDKDFAISSLMRDLTKALATLGYMVKATPKTRAPRGSGKGKTK